VTNAQPAGMFRRTPVERTDQRVAWERADQAFFAAGACHVLAWACQGLYTDRPVAVAAVRRTGDRHVSHAYSAWNGWAFDHSGWNRETQLLAANSAFERRTLERTSRRGGDSKFRLSPAAP
jgi:hypothetical protein